MVIGILVARNQQTSHGDTKGQVRQRTHAALLLYDRRRAGGDAGAHNVEAGVRQVLDAGATYGYPMQDVRVTVYDGKHHPVDSKEIAFVQAGKKAFKEAVAKASPILMEPVVDVTVTVPSRCAGGVTGDLSSMRGMVSGTETIADNRIVVSGQVPLKEMQEYHSRLKSLTGGDGSFTMDFSLYAEVPAESLDLKVAKS